MATENNATPTAEEIDILQRWVEFVKTNGHHWDHTLFGTKHSAGNIFGKPASMKSVYCVGNGFADIDMTIPGADVEVERVRVLIMFNPLQNFQVYVGYGTADNDNIQVKTDKVAETFMPWAENRLLKYLEEVFA